MYRCRHVQPKFKVVRNYESDTLGYYMSLHLYPFRVELAHYPTTITRSYVHLCKRTMPCVLICSQGKCTLFLEFATQNLKTCFLLRNFQSNILLLGLLSHVSPLG